MIEIDSLEHPLMNDEIFGPILPVLVDSIDMDEAISNQLNNLKNRWHFILF
jgi:acyl-CoA reductase-like NAD-dependent aldehyde dehydrogenase